MSRRRALFGSLLAAALFGACTTQSECEDPDGDGYGPFCELGEDCDPNNVLRNVDCEAQPAPDCAAEPVSTGCPCLDGAQTECAEELAGVGVCRAGRIVCVNGAWGRCEGAVAPGSERCDGRDEDCDGIVDEGVVSPCGACTPGCTGEVWGEAPEPFEPGEGLELTRRGELTLGTQERTFGAVWIANSAEGTLSRIDADEMRETARYPSGGTEPSRVAVDHRGDAWIINREFDGVSSVTKVAGERERCVDRDGDGLDTSSGPEDVRAIDEDECVLFHTPIGASREVARALVIDGDTGLDAASGGDAWIGLHDGQAVLEIDGLTGEERRRVPTPGFSPYAAVFDRWGTLWMISRDGLLARIDPAPEEPTVEILEVPRECFLLYGLAADPQGRLLLTGFSCEELITYDPARRRWESGPSPVSPRAAIYDPAVGFVAAHTPAMASLVAVEPLEVTETFSLLGGDASPFETIGVGVDAQGMVWTASSQGGAEGNGLATRLDPTSGEVLAQIEVGGAPHVQGDLTGSRLRVGPVPRAEARQSFEGCPASADTTWVAVHLDASPGTNGRITVEARHAAAPADLPRAAWARLGVLPGDPEPFAMDFPTGGVLEVRLILEVDGAAGAPRVRRVGVEWRCPGPD